MARYSLILRNETFVALVKRAVEKGVSVGKLINQIIEMEVRRWEGEKSTLQDSMNPHCMTCVNYVLRNNWCPIRQVNVKPTNVCKSYLRG